MTWELLAAINICLIVIYQLAKDDGIDQERRRNQKENNQ